MDARTMRDAQDTTAWVSPELDRHAAELAGRPEQFAQHPWPDPQVDLLDVRHDVTATFLATSTVASHLFVGQQVPEEHIPLPMGYTQLTSFEKRAVLLDGEVVRVWPRTEDADTYTHVLLVPPEQPGGRRLDLSVGWPIRSALYSAVEVSRRMRAPVLVARVLGSWDWH